MSFPRRFRAAKMTNRRLPAFRRNGAPRGQRTICRKMCKVNRLIQGRRSQFRPACLHSLRIINESSHPQPLPSPQFNRPAFRGLRTLETGRFQPLPGLQNGPFSTWYGRRKTALLQFSESLYSSTYTLRAQDSYHLAAHIKSLLGIACQAEFSYHLYACRALLGLLSSR